MGRRVGNAADTPFRLARGMSGGSETAVRCVRGWLILEVPLANSCGRQVIRVVEFADFAVGTDNGLAGGDAGAAGRQRWGLGDIASYRSLKAGARLVRLYAIHINSCLRQRL